MADLSAASEEDVKNFFRHYYAPNNAFLSDCRRLRSRAGEGVGAQVLRRRSPPGRAITRPNVSPVTPRRRRSGSSSRIACRCRACTSSGRRSASSSDDQYALDLLGEILTGSRTARLTKALVYDQQSAAQMFARQDSNEDVGEFRIVTVPRPGHSLTDIETAVDASWHAQGGRPDGRGDAEGEGRRGARLPDRASSRTSARRPSSRRARATTATPATSRPTTRSRRPSRPPT